jgi:hypothetical protein
MFEGFMFKFKAKPSKFKYSRPKARNFPGSAVVPDIRMEDLSVLRFPTGCVETFGPRIFAVRPGLKDPQTDIGLNILIFPGVNAIHVIDIRKSIGIPETEFYFYEVDLSACYPGKITCFKRIFSI